jgi:fructose-bisphosphate aldolase class II
VPVVSLKEIVDPALQQRYGVPAINILNDLTLEGVLLAAVQERSPLIVQTSVKTVRSIGSRVLYAMWASMTAGIEVPVSLHLDHCPDRSVISQLPVAENQRQTVEVVAEARRYGAQVEGEIESITGVEDGVGSDTESARQTLDVSLEFIKVTGVDVFAPSIGNAHGVYKTTPKLDAQRVTDVVEATGIPCALHGGSGLTDDQFKDLIARGCAKVNISTALKRQFMQSNLEFLLDAQKRDKWDPPSLFRAVQADTVRLTADLMRTFGSSGKG